MTNSTSPAYDPPTLAMQAYIDACVTGKPDSETFPLGTTVLQTVQRIYDDRHGGSGSGKPIVADRFIAVLNELAGPLIPERSDRNFEAAAIAVHRLRARFLKSPTRV